VNAELRRGAGCAINQRDLKAAELPHSTSLREFEQQPVDADGDGAPSLPRFANRVYELGGLAESDAS